MTQPLVYLNGNLVPQSEAGLPLNDAGFIWGATVTDLCRTFRHQLFRLADHLRRFRDSCHLAHVPQPVADSELAAVAHDLVEHNTKHIRDEQDLALVILATPGKVGYYLGEAGGAGDAPPTLCLHTFPLPVERYARFFREGAQLITPAIRQLPLGAVPPTIKQRSRLHWWLAEQEVHAVNPHASALLLDGQGHVTETASANLLIVRDGQILTPRAGTVLPGVSLRVLSELCAELDIPFIEIDLTLRDCARASEAMLACTSYCVAPVAQLNEQTIAFPGPVFERLLAAWSARVGLDIRGQILNQTSS